MTSCVADPPNLASIKLVGNGTRLEISHPFDGYGEFEGAEASGPFSVSSSAPLSRGPAAFHGVLTAEGIVNGSLYIKYGPALSPYACSTSSELGPMVRLSE